MTATTETFDAQYDRTEVRDAYNARHGTAAHRITAWVANEHSETIYATGVYDIGVFRERVNNLYLANLRGFGGRKWCVSTDTSRSMAGAPALVFTRQRVTTAGGSRGLMMARVRNGVALVVRGAYALAFVGALALAGVYSQTACESFAFVD